MVSECPLDRFELRSQAHIAASVPLSCVCELVFGGEMLSTGVSSPEAADRSIASQMRTTAIPSSRPASRLLAPSQHAEEMPGFAEEQLIAFVYAGESVNLAAFSICIPYLERTSHVVPMDAALGADEVHPMHRRATPVVEMNLRAEAFRKAEHDIGRFRHGQFQRAVGESMWQTV